MTTTKKTRTPRRSVGHLALASLLGIALFVLATPTSEAACWGCRDGFCESGFLAGGALCEERHEKCRSWIAQIFDLDCYSHNCRTHKVCTMRAVEGGGLVPEIEGDEPNGTLGFSAPTPGESPGTPLGGEQGTFEEESEAEAR